MSNANTKALIDGFYAIQGQARNLHAFVDQIEDQAQRMEWRSLVNDIERDMDQCAFKADVELWNDNEQPNVLEKE